MLVITGILYTDIEENNNSFDCGSKMLFANFLYLTLSSAEVVYIVHSYMSL
jgi:hypothetical protein